MTEVIEVEDCGEKIGDYDIPIHNAIIVPDNATNGDMIEAMFPNELLTSITSTLWWGDNMSFNKDWWDAPYNPTQNMQNADKSGLEYTDQETLISAT